MPAFDGDAGGQHATASRPTDVTTRIPINLAELDRLRIERGWSKQDLAEAMPVSTPTISDIYRKGWTSPRTYAKLKKLFGARARALIVVPETESA